MKRLVLVAAVMASGCNCGGASPVFVHFEGFTPHAGGLFVVRWADKGGREYLGTKQSQLVTPSGQVQFEFALPTATELRLQYFVDVNGDQHWNGPVGSGEPSWDRLTSLPAPIHNRDQIIVTVGYGTNFSELPDDFVAP